MRQEIQVRAWKLRLSDLDSLHPGLLFREDEGEEGEVFTLDAKFKGKLKNSVTTILYQLLFSHSVVFNSWQPHGLWHTRLPCPSLSPGVCSNSCPWM